MVNDLVGGVKNAMDRGQNINKIRQSFINAGYKKEEVEQAIQEVSSSVYSSPTQVQTSQPKQIPQVPQPIPVPQTQPAQIPSPPSFQQLPSPTQIQPKEKKSYLWLILIILSFLILVGAGLLGIYWDSILKLFN